MQDTIIHDEQVAALTPWTDLIDAIRDAFRAGGVSPTRHAHSVPGPGREDISLLLMPAWNQAGDFGVARLASAYVLFSGKTGHPRAVLDAGALTARRTAAASALASRYLSREDSKTLLVIGTGRAAGQLVEAHCAERPIEEIRIWGRNADNAESARQRAAEATGLRCITVPDVADSPLIEADWVEPGTHVDLVGAFKPTMCEADPATIAKADQVYVDTMEGAMDEAGDLIQAVEAGVFSFDDVAGDLYKLSASDELLRERPDEITVYKSVGVALQDLAAAQLCVERLQ